MFVIVYRWRLKVGSEQRFRVAWARMTDAIRTTRGSLGSRLHRAADGTYVAYAQWPSRAHYDRQTTSGSADADAGSEMAACVEERFPILELDVEDDRLVPPVRDSRP